MRKVIFLGILFLLFANNSAAEIDSQISKNCPGNFEPVVSMQDPNETFNNIGTPERYEYKVCVRGIIEANFKTECPGFTSFYISSNSTYAHFSEQSGYNIGVCTESMETIINETCDNSEPLFTVSEPINGFGRHIAGLHPGKRFDKFLCAFDAPPDNVTLEMKFNISSSDDVYFDDKEVTGEFEDNDIAEFPYIVGTDGDLVSGIVVHEYQRVSREIDEYNKFRVRKDVEQATYYVPFTSGTHEVLEDDQERFFERSIEDSLNPSFAMDLGGEPVVRAIARQDAVIVSNLSIGGGSHSIRIEKTGDNEITIEQIS